MRQQSPDFQRAEGYQRIVQQNQLVHNPRRQAMVAASSTSAEFAALPDYATGGFIAGVPVIKIAWNDLLRDGPAEPIFTFQRVVEFRCSPVLPDVPVQRSAPVIPDLYLF